MIILTGRLTGLTCRPLPSGRISVREVWALFALFTGIGLVTAALLLVPVLVPVTVLWGISLLYTMKLKEYRFFGNLIVAGCLGMIFVLAGIIAGTIKGVVATFAALAFFFDLGEEIASDVMDLEGEWGAVLE